MQNYTSGHETNAKQIQDRLVYPDKHIEADNRLSWFLGSLENQYGDEPYYVHLIRNKEKCVESFNKRWDNQGSIIHSFSEGILMNKVKNLNTSERKEIISLYYDTVNQNIESFLANKSKKMVIALEDIKSDFKVFWKHIHANGNLDAALDTFNRVHNESKVAESGFVEKIKRLMK